MIYTLRNVMGHEVVELWHKDTALQDVEMVVLPGGFSYGDYLRSGAIARFSPIMESVIEFANQGGYVLGICNGFQVLCETHLLPGTLLHNPSHSFICKNAWLKPHSTGNAITAQLEKDRAYKIPVAHGEGRYYIEEREVQKLADNNQILFQYCSPSGEINDDANFNGSVHNIAGVCNEGKNVYGMMPHPERAADANLSNEDGKISVSRSGTEHG
ncbi:purQ [Symbiodinium sp. CCMP2456]|nr:purQ [Symbiodinium sp. CCMP2456]